MHDFEDLGDRTRQLSLRRIRQRATILQALYRLGGNASAEQVCNQLTHHRHGMDLSTVHHTLETLHELGIVSRTDVGYGCAVYAIVGEQPDHRLICCQCGRMTEVADDYLFSIAGTIRQDFDFEPESSRFVVFGICQACRGMLQHDRA